VLISDEFDVGVFVVSYTVILKGDNVALLVFKPLGHLIEPGVSFYMVGKVIFGAMVDMSRVGFMEEELYCHYGRLVLEA